MFLSIFCLLKKGLLDTGLFFHILFPIMLVEMVLEMVLINYIEDKISSMKKDEDETE